MSEEVGSRALLTFGVRARFSAINLSKRAGWSLSCTVFA
jgi:hypothetical protein